MNMVTLNHGMISVENPIVGLEQQPTKHYIKFILPDSGNTEQTFSITFKGKTFKGNNKQTI